MRNSSDVDSTANARATLQDQQQQQQQATSRRSSCLVVLRQNQKAWIVINAISLIVWIFSMVGTFHCSFLMVERTGLVASGDDSSTRSLHEIVGQAGRFLSGGNESSTEIDHPVGLGLFSTSVYDTDSNLLGCVSYYGTSSEFDGVFRAARTFGMMAALATSIALVLVTLVNLFLETPPTNLGSQLKGNLWSAAKFLFFGAFLCELLTFLAFGRDFCNRDDMTCRPGAASILNILNLILLGVQSALIYAVPPVAGPFFLLQATKPGDQKPMSVIDMDTDAAKDTSVLSEGGKFEILSNPLSSVDSEQQQNQQQPAKVYEDDLHSDLESDHGKDVAQSQNIIMEGIECVANDQYNRQKSAKGTWETIVHKYHAIGKKKCTRVTMAAVLCKAWVFTVVGVTRCTFLLVGATGQEREALSGLGLFNRAYYMNDDVLGCIAYPPSAKEDFDGAFEVARAFGMITLLLMTVCFVSFCVLHGFIEAGPKKEWVWWTMTQLTLPVAFVSQLVTFSAFETESCTHSENTDCVPGVAGIFAILNVFLVFPLAFFIFALPCPTKPFFRMRRPPPRIQTPRFIKSQAQIYKEFQLRRKQKQQARKQQERDHPEPTSDSGDGSENASFDDGVRVRSFASKVKQTEETSEDGEEEGCTISTVIEERDGKRTITKEMCHADGSKTITIVVEDFGYIGKSGKPNRVPVASGRGTKVRVEPTGSATAIPSSRQSSTGISSSGSWDSRASVEQFEIVDMDTSESSSVHVRQGSHGAVQAAAMSIIREMQEEEERKWGQVADESETHTCTASSDVTDTYDGEEYEMESTEYVQSTDDGITFNTGDVNYNDRR